MLVCDRKMSCREKKKARQHLDTSIESAVCWDASILWMNALTPVLFSVAEGPAESKSLSVPTVNSHIGKQHLY